VDILSMADKGQWYFLAAVLFGLRHQVREHSSMVVCSLPSQQWEIHILQPTPQHHTHGEWQIMTNQVPVALVAKARAR
jgi:hypothetical protein